jgi:uncharacterized membrane protein YjgN (DUF898 family)
LPAVAARVIAAAPSGRIRAVRRQFATEEPMTGLEASGRSSVPLVAGRSYGNARFRGDPAAFWRLMVRGALLLMLTLGIYRFWLATDVRRFLWSNSEIAGHSLDYTGTPTELLIGFLIAITILVPINALLFLILFLETLAQYATMIGFLFLAFLGQVAVYRARRYRLTRTVLRGIRFHQTGSSWRYAVCASFWWILAIASFGLLYPFAVASLERFKLRNTYYGNLPGRFVGTGARLFLRGLLIWLLVMGPFLFGLIVALATIDPDALVNAIEGGGDALRRFGDPAVYVGMAAVAFGLGWTAFAAFLLYPVFQAMVLRWWASGLRFGEVTVTSNLRTRRVYGVYLRFLLYGVLFGIVSAVAITISVTLWVGIARGGALPTLAAEIGGAALAVLGYLAVVLGYWAIYQATVKLSLWRLVMDSLDLSGVAALDRVTAAGQPSSAVGEGLADALNVGGL